MKNALFQSIKVKRPKTNVFDLSHEKKMSGNMGELIPIFVQEIVPGDRFRVNSEMLLRLAPLLAPMMHRVNVFTHWFFVPNRLVFEDWPEFITGGTDGKAVVPFPKMTLNSAFAGNIVNGTLADYMGLPSRPNANPFDGQLEVSALPFRAYQLIYNEYYRDQTLQPEVALTKNSTVDNAEAAAILSIRRRCWEKDYLTSALPWPQRGDDVLLPMDNIITYKNAETEFLAGGGGGSNVTNNTISGQRGQLQDGGGVIKIENIDDIESQITINDLRRSMRLQEWLEKNARAGSRYIEQILSHFGVRSSDARLQRPEYLGGARTPIVISESLSTVKTTEDPQANMAGHGIAVGSSHGFKKFFEEHGYVIGIMSVMPRTAYQQGLPRMFTKFDKFDYYWPEFAHLGEQEIKTKEAYFNFNSNVDNESIFGYQSRYAEYKFNQSTVHGDFKGNMAYWHMGRIFDTKPGLNNNFVEGDPTERIFAVTGDVHHMYVQLYNDVKAVRPMPVFSIPR